MVKNTDLIGRVEIDRKSKALVWRGREFLAATIYKWYRYNKYQPSFFIVLPPLKTPITGLGDGGSFIFLTLPMKKVK